MLYAAVLAIPFMFGLKNAPLFNSWREKLVTERWHNVLAYFCKWFLLLKTILDVNGKQ